MKRKLILIAAALCTVAAFAQNVQSADNWYVCLGSFKSAANARQFSSILKEQGLPNTTTVYAAAAAALYRVLYDQPFERQDNARIFCSELLNDNRISLLKLSGLWICKARSDKTAIGANASNNMVLVEGGTFQMGNNDEEAYDWEKPVHTVTVSSFYMSKYEVTQAEYKAVMGENPSYFTGNNLPVESVSWYDAVEYCNKRSKKEGLTPCYTIDGTNVTCNWKVNGYRLPTEAEWEYAVRGGKNNSPYEYSGSDNIDEVAWYWENSGEGLKESDPNYGTHEVGKKKANALGIYDMSGNVYEWCWDWHSWDYYKNSVGNNPLGPASGDGRVARGGGWGRNAVNCRCAYRNNYDPSGRRNYLGFRVVCSK